MRSDYREFLRMLRREPGRPVLFEPDPSHGSVAQIIWRAGALLWDSPEHTVMSVCAIASMLRIKADQFTKPFIFMARSDRRSEVESAIECGAAGIYVPCDAEFLWERYNDKIAILGGMSDSLIAGSPVRVHERVRSLHAMTEGRGYAFGSGLIRAEADYLAFISMLGMFNTLCEKYS